MAEPLQSPGPHAARMARDAIERVLYAIPNIPFDFDRQAVGTRMQRAIECCYMVMDSPPLALVHHDGLLEARTLVEEARAWLTAAQTPSTEPNLSGALDSLKLALSALELGAEGVGKLHFEHRTELHEQRAEAQVLRPFKASRGAPVLHTVARTPLGPPVSLDPVVALIDDAPPPPATQLAVPETEEALKALAKALSSGALAEYLAQQVPDAAERDDLAQDDDQPKSPEEAAEPIYLPALAEAQVLRELAREHLDEIAVGRDLRKPNELESWTDQGPFEQRMLNSLDALVALGEPALRQISLYLAEAEIADPGRAFAAALVLGSVEGSDTVAAAVSLLRQSDPDTYPGWREGLVLAPNPVVNRAMEELSRAPHKRLAALAVEVLAARGAARDEVLAPLLRDETPEVARAVAQALGCSHEDALARTHLEPWLMQADDDALFEAVATSVMCRGLVEGRAALRAVLEREEGSARGHIAAWLLCLGGGEGLAQLLVSWVRRYPKARTVRGLGRYGHIAALQPLIALLQHPDELVAEAAADALEMISGAGLKETIEEPWPIELPPIPDDVFPLPIPMRRVERVVRDPEVWSDWYARHRHKLKPETRYRHGRAWLLTDIVDELEHDRATPVRRDEAARELLMASNGIRSFDCDDWVARQRLRLAGVRETIEALGAPAGCWLFGYGKAERVSSAPPPSDPQRGTVMFEAVPLMPSPMASSALPFRPGVATAPSGQPPAPAEAEPQTEEGLTLEQYASLQAEFIVKPQVYLQTLERYGLDEAGYAAEQERWSERAKADPALAKRRDALILQYRAWLLKQR